MNILALVLCSLVAVAPKIFDVPIETYPGWHRDQLIEEVWYPQPVHSVFDTSPTTSACMKINIRLATRFCQDKFEPKCTESVVTAFKVIKILRKYPKPLKAITDVEFAACETLP